MMIVANFVRVNCIARSLIFAVLCFLYFAGLCGAQEGSVSTTAVNSKLAAAKKQQKQLIQITQRKIYLGRELQKLKKSPITPVVTEKDQGKLKVNWPR